MERTEWPTSSYLEDLRDRGLFPYSRLCTSAIAVVAMCFCLWLQRGAFGRLLSLANRIVLASEPGREALLSDLSKQLMFVFAAPAVAVALSITISGMLQSRFFFRSPGAPAGDNAEIGLPARFFGHMAGSGLGILFAVGIGLYCCSRTMHLLNMSGDSLAALTRVFAESFPFLLAVFLGLAIGGCLFSRFAFRLSHRMTRAELESEMREG